MNMNQQQSGFVILFAVLIASIILLIGVGMFRVSIKETILSSTARESTIAFFAADTGIECALHGDIKQLVFPIPTTGSQILQCGDDFDVYGPNSNAYTFRIKMPGDICAFVQVDKSVSGQVEITSRGYNICDGDMPDTTDPLLLERVLFIRYQGS